jgi:Pyruvate/2-oxoacid:ferredoxin oxidoreductase gamma subunit
MLGALVEATGLVSLDSIEKVLTARFKGSLGESNAVALRLGYEKVKSG